MFVALAPSEPLASQIYPPFPCSKLFPMLKLSSFVLKVVREDLDPSGRAPPAVVVVGTDEWLAPQVTMTMTTTTMTTTTTVVGVHHMLIDGDELPSLPR